MTTQVQHQMDQYGEAERHLRLALEALPQSAVNMRATVAAMAEQAHGRRVMLIERTRDREAVPS